MPERSTTSARSRRRWALGAAYLGALGVLGFLYLSPSRPQLTPVKPQEAARKDLVLRNGVLFQADGSVPFNGFVLDYYDGVELKSRSSVSNGLLEGLSEGWHTNGQKQVQEYFHAGRSEGIRTKWYADGSKLSEAHIVDGKLDGTFRRWHEDGSLAEQVELKDGDPDGLSRSFYPSGFVKAEARLRRGKILDQKFWKDGEFGVSPHY